MRNRLTSIRSLVEFTCNPLNRELFKQQYTGTYQKGKQQFQNQVQDLGVPFGRIFFSARKNYWLECDP